MSLRRRTPTSIRFILVVVSLCSGTLRAFADDSTQHALPLRAYAETISDVGVSFDMVPIPGGRFRWGSPDSEVNRKEDEGPQIEVMIEPFWMGKYEVTWDEFDVWSYRLDVKRRKEAGTAPTTRDRMADAVTRPTAPYVDPTFGMGHEACPAICMTQHAAKMYCQWLSKKTGHYYRLPTEAEWEYACRAGTKTAYSFGNNPDDLDDYGWFYDNSDERYHKVGQKKPNPWGLYDMHGNVSEWVLDRYEPDWYLRLRGNGQPVTSPLNIPTKVYPRVVRGGSWDDDRDDLRSAARFASTPDWKSQDAQIPRSIWHHTDALHVGFRIVRPFRPPSAKERTERKLGAEGEIAR